MNSYDPSNWEVEARGSRIQLHTKFEVLLCYMRSYLKSTIIIINNNNNNNNNTMVADTLLKTVGCIPCRLASLCSTVQKLQVLCVLQWTLQTVIQGLFLHLLFVWPVNFCDSISSFIRGELCLFSIKFRELTEQMQIRCLEVQWHLASNQALVPV